MEPILRLENLPFLEKERLVVAVSGGSDSLGLLTLLLRHFPDPARRLRVAHVNYGLRGRAARTDEERVKGFCADHHVPVRVLRVRGFKEKVRKEKRSPQDLARAIRYSYFQEVVRREKAWGVAVAHHLEDQAETVLDRLLRGAGPRGLSGLRPIQVLDLSRTGKPLKVWRPLLKYSKEQIQNYLKTQGIEWREDASNQMTLYRRNQIRHQVLPFLSKWNPNLTRNLARLAEVIQSEDDFLEGLLPFLDRKLKIRRRRGRFECRAEAFFRMPLALQRRWVRKAGGDLCGTAMNLSYERVGSVLRVWRGEEKGPRDLGFGLSVDRKDPWLLLTYRSLPAKVSKR